jgi:hypothetical protein
MEAIQLRTRCVPTLALVDIPLDGRVEGLRDVWHVINLLVQQQDSEGLADCLGHGVAENLFRTGSVNEHACIFRITFPQRASTEISSMPSSLRSKADCNQQCVFIDGLDRELNGAGPRAGIVTTDVRDIHISTPRA